MKTSQSPGRRRRAAVPRPGDLIDRLEDHPGAGGARQLRRAVGRVVVADDKSRWPTRGGRRPPSPRFTWRKRLPNEPLLVERRDDDRDLHRCRARLGGRASSRTLKSKTYGLVRTFALPPWQLRFRTAGWWFRRHGRRSRWCARRFRGCEQVAVQAPRKQPPDAHHQQDG